jgi:hypothetical protein
MLASAVLDLKSFDLGLAWVSSSTTAGRAIPRLAREATVRAGTFEVANDDQQTPKQQLASRLAAALGEFSQLAMHFTPDFRTRTVRQLRNLLDPEEWEYGDALLDPQSFRSFARAMAFLQPNLRPMLGLSNRGNILAMWADARGQLSFEHIADDRLRWFISRGEGKDSDTAAGDSTLLRLSGLVDAHGMRALLDGAG